MHKLLNNNLRCAINPIPNPLTLNKAILHIPPLSSHATLPAHARILPQTSIPVLINLQHILNKSAPLTIQAKHPLRHPKASDENPPIQEVQSAEHQDDEVVIGMP